MASDWIKVRTVLPTDGRLRIASRKCHVLPVTVFGALVTLWCLADSHADQNGELIGYTCEDIDTHVGVPGFCNSLPVDWIDASGEFVKLPQYQEHNGTTGKTRAQDSKRQKLSRSNRDKSVTREEKKREEKKEEQAAPVGADPLAEISPKLAADFRALRKAKRSPITQTAVDGIAREAAKAGLTLESAVAMCCERGWAGFNASWLANRGEAPAIPKTRKAL